MKMSTFESKVKWSPCMPEDLLSPSPQISRPNRSITTCRKQKQKQHPKPRKPIPARSRVHKCCKQQSQMPSTSGLPSAWPWLAPMILASQCSCNLISKSKIAYNRFSSLTTWALTSQWGRLQPVVQYDPGQTEFGNSIETEPGTISRQCHESWALQHLFCALSRRPAGQSTSRHISNDKVQENIRISSDIWQVTFVFVSSAMQYGPTRPKGGLKTCAKRLPTSKSW